jgi:phosphonate transport system ATP-binding protein
MPDADAAMLRFEGVVKRYPDGTRALGGVTFDVPRGQFCAIIGPSGSGKSTLLRLVNGLVELTGGAIAFDGGALGPGSIASIQRRVGTVHQEFDLVPRLSVLDNVLAGTLPVVSTARVLLRLWPRHHQRRACRLLARVGLTEEQLYRRAAQLSGGQKQRVAIARAFMLDPAVVLADEPVSSLDPAVSRSVLRLLREASAESGATVLCSLHQVELAIEFADRIVAIQDGAVVYDGAPSDLTEQRLDEVYGAERTARSARPGDAGAGAGAGSAGPSGEAA